jgi:hypothetical protein
MSAVCDSPELMHPSALLFPLLHEKEVPFSYNTPRKLDQKMIILLIVTCVNCSRKYLEAIKYNKNYVIKNLLVVEFRLSSLWKKTE